MNSLHHNDLKNVVVVLRPEKVTGTTSDLTTRLFRCTGGNGLKHANLGSAIFGVFLCNLVHGKNMARIDAMEDIERLATDKEIALAH